MLRPSHSSALIAACFLSLLQTSASAFPSAHESAPNWWPPSQPKFVLSQDYPATLPAPENYPWKQIDFRTQGLDYLRSVLAYVYEGNVTGPVERTWQVHINPVRKWYHTPWMEVSKNGREFVRGLTRERTSVEGELWSDPPSPLVQNWAVGFYNPPGGFIIGQMWKDPANPDPAAAQEFPDGTVAAKLLFTAATPQDVPYLRGSVQWLANIHSMIDCRIRDMPDDSPPCERRIQPVRLLQIDVAIKDSRANATGGWVFGTFVYDGSAPGQTPWERMIPVGVMWGNDPGISPDSIKAGDQLKESVINRAKMPTQHLGCAGRLNGPVDNPVSSCMSCHARAQFPAPAMVPRSCDSSAASLSFFTNVTKDSPRPAGTLWFDYSLQLSTAFENFCEANNTHPRCRTAPVPPGAPPAAAAAASPAPRQAISPPPKRGD
jgi:hypothetical protein